MTFSPRRLAAQALVGALFLVSPGLAPYQAAAQVIGMQGATAAGANGAVGAVGIQPLGTNGLILPLSPLNTLNSGLNVNQLGGIPTLPASFSAAGANAVIPGASGFVPVAGRSIVPSASPISVPTMVAEARIAASISPSASVSAAHENVSAAAETLASAESPAQKAGWLERFFTGARERLGLSDATPVSAASASSEVETRPAAFASLTPASLPLSRAVAPVPVSFKGRGLIPGEKFLSAASENETPAAKPAPEPAKGDDWINGQAIKWMMIQRNISIPVFILTSLAYPAIVIPALGPVAFGALLSLGSLAAIALGPLNGAIINKLEPRVGLAGLSLMRAALSAALPILALTGSLTFVPLLIAAIGSGWQFSLLMSGEPAYYRKFAGTKHIPNITSAGFIGYFAMQFIMGSLLVVGAMVDAWSPMTPFWISAAVNVALAAINWFKIPAMAPFAAAVDKAAVSVGERITALGKGIKDFAKKFWKEGAIFAGAIATYVVGLPFGLALPIIGTGIGSPLLMAGSLLYWVTRTDMFRTMWGQKEVRVAILLSSLAAGLVYPLQNYLLPLVAGSLGPKSLVYGQLLGAFFFGQLVSNTAMVKGLPKLFGRPAEFWIRGLVIGLGALWAGLRLFPGNWLAMGGALAIGGAMMYAASRMTDRGWIRFLGVGFLAVAGLAAFWGSYPGIFASVMLLGFFMGPFVSAINTYISKASDPKHISTNFGVSGSILNAATAFGYALMAAAVKSQGDNPLPAALTPIIIAFAVAGIAFYLAPRWLKSLPGKSLKGSSESK